MDPIEPMLERETRRRRRQRLFSSKRIPVRLMVPNFFTLLGLCAGLTSIRMGIDARYDIALAAIVFAAFLDGIDGRVARLLKASSRFGAELDSLADFVNFGVAPAFLIFNWGLGGAKSIGWICVMMFALASAMRLARFNAAIDEEHPRWQSNFFIGMPTPAAAIVVLLPIYLESSGLLNVRGNPLLIRAMLFYVMVIAILMVSIVPTYSGKLIGERIGREWVLPAIFAAIGFVALLVTYTYETLVGATLLYLASIVWSTRRFQGHLALDAAEAATRKQDGSAAPADATAPAQPPLPPSGESLH